MRSVLQAIIGFILLIWLVFWYTAISQADMVTRIVDGDTFACGETIYRLYGVDAFELPQKEGLDAKLNLGKLILGKDVKIVHAKSMYMLMKKKGLSSNIGYVDDWGRHFAIVLFASTVVNESMIRSGWAVADTSACVDPPCTSYKDIEDEARRTRVGAWRSDNVIVPKDFRANMWQRIGD